VAERMAYHNQERRHSSIGYRAPATFVATLRPWPQSLNSARRRLSKNRGAPLRPEIYNPSYIPISTLVTLAGGRLIWTCAPWDSTARPAGLMALGASKVL
jgi:hypothetical protein